jgi:hypothetical protein
MGLPWRWLSQEHSSICQLGKSLPLIVSNSTMFHTYRCQMWRPVPLSSCQNAFDCGLSTTTILQRGDLRVIGAMGDTSNGPRRRFGPWRCGQRFGPVSVTRGSTWQSRGGVKMSNVEPYWTRQLERARSFAICRCAPSAGSTGYGRCYS